MNREILFRGKRTGNGEWVEGDLIHYKDNDTRIMEKNAAFWDVLHDGEQVDPETVGQYTGVKDSEGNKIFEGDILKCYHNGGFIEAKISWGSLAYGLTNINSKCLAPNYYYWDKVKTIGNIHDNPELIKGE